MIIYHLFPSIFRLRIMSSEIKNFNEKINSSIGYLLSQADEISKTVISAFDPSKDISVNKNVLGGSRFTPQILDTCAKFLKIPTTTRDGTKIYSNKPTLAQRIIIEIQSFYPTFCAECNEEYSIQFNSEESPLLQCFLCYQGSHNCEALKSKVPSESIILPTGTIWFCKSCYDLNTPFKQNKSKSKPTNDFSSSLPTDLNRHHEHVSCSGRIELQVEKQQSEPEPNTNTNLNPTHPVQMINNDICELYILGKCPHGISGNKLHNGVKCNKQHPKRCKRFMKNGVHNRYGCTKGDRCTLYHVIHCTSSLNNKTCYLKDCTFVHLAGTKRKKDSVNPQSSSKVASSDQLQSSPQSSPQPQNSEGNTHSQNRGENSRHSVRKAKSNTQQNPTNDTSFLELRKLLTDFQDNVQKEMCTIRASIMLQENRMTHFFPSFNHSLPRPPMPLQSQIAHPVQQLLQNQVPMNWQQQQQVPMLHSQMPLNFQQFPVPGY